MLYIKVVNNFFSILQGVVKCIQEPLLPKPYPVVQHAITNEAVGTKS
jgi:hypothetical protein